MKYTIAIALLAISTSAAAFQPQHGAVAAKVWQAEQQRNEAAVITAPNRGGETVLHQNEQNDPSIHGRRTQTAFEEGGVGQGETHDSTPVSIEEPEVYPAIDEYNN